MKRLQLVPQDTNFDFVHFRKITFILASFFLGVSLFFLSTKGLNYGIDFKGGHVFEVRLPEKKDIAIMRQTFAEKKIGDVSIQEIKSDFHDLLIKVEFQEGDIHGVVKNVLGEGVHYRKVEVVGPKVGKILINNGIKAVLFSLLAMLVYMLIRFQLSYAVCAILALTHDCVCVLALFSIFPLEFNETALIGLLITAGYSINDTIVIFDRIRENRTRFPHMERHVILNRSINETLSRTVVTAATTVLALFALYFFGGQIIASFSLPIIVGIVLGSFSSICLAAPLLLMTKERPICDKEEDISLEGKYQGK